MTKEKTELKVNTFKFSTAPAEEDTTAAEIGEDLFFGIAMVKKPNAAALLAIAPILFGSFRFKHTIIFVPSIKEKSDSFMKFLGLQIATTLYLSEYVQLLFCK